MCLTLRIKMLNKLILGFSVLSVMGALFYSHAWFYRQGYDKASHEAAQAENTAIKTRDDIRREIEGISDSELDKRYSRWVRP